MLSGALGSSARMICVCSSSSSFSVSCAWSSGMTTTGSYSAQPESAEAPRTAHKAKRHLPPSPSPPTPAPPRTPHTHRRRPSHQSGMTACHCCPTPSAVPSHPHALANTFDRVFSLGEQTDRACPSRPSSQKPASPRTASPRSLLAATRRPKHSRHLPPLFCAARYHPRLPMRPPSPLKNNQTERSSPRAPSTHKP